MIPIRARIPSAALIRSVSTGWTSAFSASASAGSGSKRGTGGMSSKLRAAREASRAGIETWLVRGDVPGVLIEVARGQALGTRVIEGAPRGATQGVLAARRRDTRLAARFEGSPAMIAPGELEHRLRAARQAARALRAAPRAAKDAAARGRRSAGWPSAKRKILAANAADLEAARAPAPGPGKQAAAAPDRRRFSIGSRYPRPGSASCAPGSRPCARRAIPSASSSTSEGWRTACARAGCVPRSA